LQLATKATMDPTELLHEHAEVGPGDWKRDVLTIGFGRRFASYKRAHLLFQDLDRLAELIGNPKRPVQLLFAGKAHPQDHPGKAILQSIAQLQQDPRFRGRLIFLPNYDMQICRAMVQGVDLWLNTPRRPLEASGTSGQKAAINGVLHCSVLDGWWAEAYDGTNGFAIGKGEGHADDAAADARDAAYLMELLEAQVVPLYYRQSDLGIPEGWIERMKNSIRTCSWRFSSHRMLADYVRHSYLPAAGLVQSPNRVP
jgi:starch phosphorylase